MTTLTTARYRGAVFTCRHAPLTVSPDVAQFLVTAYSEPHRAYHNAAHITDVLRWFDWVADEAGWDQVADVYLAVLFHDVVYDPAAQDNEARSADIARALGGATEHTAELILFTARHGSLTRADVDRDAAHFLDCDIAVLGSPDAEFDAYDAAVALEYKHLPPETFRRGRRTFLTDLLHRPRIFLSARFHARLDGAARANLARAIARY